MNTQSLNPQLRKVLANISAARKIRRSDEVRLPARAAKEQHDDDQAIVKRILARETFSEKRERAFRCPHGDYRALCLACAGLGEAELREWNKCRTKQRRILHRPGGRPSEYIAVRTSSADCVLVGRKGALSYRCLKCNQVTVMDGGTKLRVCPECGGTVQTIPSFQSYQFSPEIGQGANRERYGDNTPAAKPALSEKAFAARDLSLDPNSRVNKGGVGHLRIPPDDPRGTRADAPEWLDLRENFFRILRPGRAGRAEAILSGFYLQNQTDTQIAQAVGWTKDAVKKERATLIKDGDAFFQNPIAKQPPSPAMGEKGSQNAISDSVYPNHPPSIAIRGEGFPASSCLQEPRLLLPTGFVAVCAPDPEVLHLYPVFTAGEHRLAQTGQYYVPVASLEGLLREQPAAPQPRELSNSDQWETAYLADLNPLRYAPPSVIFRENISE